MRLNRLLVELSGLATAQEKAVVANGPEMATRSGLHGDELLKRTEPDFVSVQIVGLTPAEDRRALV